nr:hypothetical protein [Candidatus Levybacteria bacterium]
MAKRKKVSKSKGRVYRAETYGIKFNSLTFLLFALFALMVSLLLVSSMLGINLY